MKLAPNRFGGLGGLEPLQSLADGRFELGPEIGRGAMGVVYLAHDRERGTDVALKTLDLADPDRLYALKREFRSAVDVRHRNVARLYELFEERGNWFFTMELVRGTEWVRWVRSETGEDRFRRARGALIELASGLQAFHEAGRVHLDVKPSNALVEEEGRVVLLDFGLTLDLETDPSKDGSGWGSVAYMSPEHLAGKVIGPESDLYAVGVVLFEALTGRLPFEGDVREQCQAKSLSAPFIDVEAPSDLDDLCRSLLSPYPDERPDASGLIQALRGRVSSPLSVVPRTDTFRPEALFGRESELQTLSRAWREATGWRAVVINGESGMGKTSLARTFVHRLRKSEPDAAVLWTRCFEHEYVPYRALDGLLDQLSEVMSRLPPGVVDAVLPMDTSLLRDAFPVLARVPAIADYPSYSDSFASPHEQRLALSRALQALLTELGHRRPILLVIDDLQWADADSLWVLRDMASSASAPPLLLIGCTRPRGNDDAALSEVGRCDTIMLSALQPQHATEMAMTVMRRSGLGDPTDAERIARESAGHPLFVTELIRHAGLSETPQDRPLVLEDAVRARVERLPPMARQLLLLLTIAARPLSRDVLRKASGLDVAQLHRWEETLKAEHLVRTAAGRRAHRLELIHDRVRSCLGSALDSEQARKLHGRLVDALRVHEPGRPDLLVHHLVGADRPHEAARQAWAAARQAKNALAFGRAAQLYEIAWRLGEWTGDEACDLRVECAEALADVGRGSEAADLYLEAADADRERRRLSLLERAADQLLCSGQIDRGIEVLDQLLRDLGSSLPRSPQRALMSLLWQRGHLAMRGHHLSLQSSPIGTVERLKLDTFWAVGRALGQVDPIRASELSARHLLLALRRGDEYHTALGLCLEAIFQATQGIKHAPKARQLLGLQRQLVQGQRDPLLSWWATFAEGMVAFVTGDNETAVLLFRASTGQLERAGAGQTWERSICRLFESYALREQGRLSELHRLSVQTLSAADQCGNLYVSTSIRRFTNLTWLAADKPERAEAELDTATWDSDKGRFHMQHLFELEARAQLALYRGDAAAAFDALDPEFDKMDSSLMARVERLRAIALSVHGRLLIGASDGSPRRLKAAARRAAQLQRIPGTYSHMLATLILAGVDVRQGERERGVERFGSCAQQARDCGMMLYAAAADWRRGALMGDAQGLGLCEEAAGWMRGEGVLNPSRMANVLAPI